MSKLLIAFVVTTLTAFAQVVPGKYILLIQDEPVSAHYAGRTELNSAAALNYRQQVEARQAAIKRDLTARSFVVTGSTSVLANVIFVNAPASRIAELRAISGVTDVRPMRKFKKNLDQATQQLNGPAAWSALGGTSNAGLGMKIAIVDSGIDQTHAAFQDRSLPMPAGFPIVTSGHPEDVAYTTNKVIVARSYVRLLAAGSNPNNNAADDVPDDYSPRDREGHGTAVASCAAAISTTTPGVTATGGAVVIQGMAPKAYLGNYKIAGSPGVDDFATDQTLIQAVDDAVSDGMDIITTSWGSGALTDVAHDPVAMAWQAATKYAVVLAAAGNAGNDPLYWGFNYPGFNTINSPGNAPDVISVGATENGHVLLPTVSVNGANAPASLLGIPAQPSDSQNYPSAQGSSTAVLIDVTSLGDDGTACAALPGGSLSGKFVLVLDAGSCTDTQKATNAENAGAAGMIIYSASATAVPIEGVGQNNTGDASFIGPIVGISNSAGIALKNYVDANAGTSVTISAGALEQTIQAWSQQYVASNGVVVTPNQLVTFSSMGPTPDGQMKPDVVATGGNDIFSLGPDSTDSYLPGPSGIFMATQSYDPQSSDYSSNGYWAADGTSFATPLVAGTAALVKQTYLSRNLRPTQIKSLIVNNASQTVGTDDFGDPVDAEWMGAGLVNAGAAVAGTITAEPSTISFGFLNGVSLPITKTVTVTNIGTGPVTLAASVSCCNVNAFTGTLSNATLSLSSSSISLAAGASTTLTVTLSGATPKASEYSGAILLQQGSTTVSRIPFMMIVGSGVAYNGDFFVGGEGAPNKDIGPAIVQVTDQYGMPVAGSPVTFTISPSGGVALSSVSGEPACTTSARSTVCNTDQFGFAYAEVTTGPVARAVTLTAVISGNATRVPNTINVQVPPQITGIAEAAAGLTTVAPGSYIAIYGANMANYAQGTVNSTYYDPSIPTTSIAKEATDPVIANGAVLPLQIDGVSVSFDAGGISVPGHIHYVSPGQVNVLVPWELQGQTSVQVKVTLNGDLFSNVFTLPLASASPAFFAYGTTPLGTDASGNLLTPTNAAKRGATIVLYANGLGPVTNTPASGDPAASVPLSKSMTLPTVTIGGQVATVTFAGLTPTLPGLYQINVQVPAGTPTGPQNITIAAGGTTSPGLVLAVQ